MTGTLLETADTTSTDSRDSRDLTNSGITWET